MKHISLFSGGGGFDLAAEWAGWDNIVSCEIEEFQNKILEYYWPNAYHHRDIKTLTVEKIDYETKKRFGNDWRENGVIITGGFPCQPFSLAGKRNGTEDNRYLWPEMFRIIKELQPDWVVAENVAGITSMVFQGEVSEVGNYSDLFNENNKVYELRQEYVLHRIIQDIESEGYEVQPFIIPAAAVGASHKRDRIWIIANTNSKGLQRFEESRDTNKKRTYKKQFIGRFFQPTWEKFPTQSPICSGNDGFPYYLDGITFPEWRKETLKTFGNAIVPQVAYMIFKTINSIISGKIK